MLFGFLTLAVFRAVWPVFEAVEVLARAAVLDLDAAARGFVAEARFLVAVALRAGLLFEGFARRTGFFAAGTE